MESQSGYLENYSFFDWKPVMKRLRSGLPCSCLLWRENNLNLRGFLSCLFVGGGGGEENVSASTYDVREQRAD